MNIGILGGTFDPIHLGHLIIAQEVKLRLGLDRMLFIPAGQPWLKEAGRMITPGKHRLEMVRLAIATNPYFEVSSIELERKGPSYSIDTVRTLRDKLGPEANLYFIVGLDALQEFSSWRDPESLTKLCQIVGVSRPGYAEFDLEKLDSTIPGISSRIIVLSVPEIEISSTEIRERVAQGLPIRYLVPEPVERYIFEHKLYYRVK